MVFDAKKDEKEGYAIESLGNDKSATKHPSHALKIRLPANTSVVQEARKKAGDKNARMNEIAQIIMHDPVTTMELLPYSKCDVLFTRQASYHKSTKSTRSYGLSSYN